MKALIIEDDQASATFACKILEKHNINCDVCNLGEDGLLMIESCEYDVIIVDISLPDMDGNSIIRQIRSSKKINKKFVPIIVLSNLQSSSDKVESLLNGADDFLTKPYDQKEFLMRVLTIIRRSNGYSDNVINIGELSLDMKKKSVSVNNNKLNLSSKEYSIVQLLMLKKNSLLDKHNLLDALYCGTDVPGSKVIDVFVCNIRKKIAFYTKKNYLITSWGNGYIITDPKMETLKEVVVMNG